MVHLNHKLFRCILTISALMCAKPVFATENGQQTYPVGVNTVLNGLAPLPGGTQFYNYTEFYVANKFAGANGDNAVPGFRSTVIVDALRVAHTYDFTIGPFTVSSGIVVPFVRASIDLPNRSGNRAALADIYVHPIYINYTNSSHTFFASFYPAVGFPTGAYSTTRIANTGLNTYAFMPSLQWTWFPVPDWEFSGAATFEMNSPDHATDYHSGDLTMFEYVIGYSVSAHFQVGLQGYYLKQITDDKVAGQLVAGNGFRGQVAAIGPQLRYDWGPGSGIAIKYQQQFAARNRPQGESVWLEVTLPIR